MPFVYILQGKNGKYYIGSTNNLERRILEHNSGKTKYTKEILPITLVFKQYYETIIESRRIEQRTSGRSEACPTKPLLRSMHPR